MGTPWLSYFVILILQVVISERSKRFRTQHTEFRPGKFQFWENRNCRTQTSKNSVRERSGFHNSLHARPTQRWISWTYANWQKNHIMPLRNILCQKYFRQTSQSLMNESNDLLEFPSYKDRWFPVRTPMFASLTRWNAHRCHSLETAFLIFEAF